MQDDFGAEMKLTIIFQLWLLLQVQLSQQIMLDKTPRQTFFWLLLHLQASVLQTGARVVIYQTKRPAVKSVPALTLSSQPVGDRREEDLQKVDAV